MPETRATIADTFGHARGDSEREFNEHARFILENFPSSKTTLHRIIDTALEGMEVVEERDNDDDLEGILTYQIRADPYGETYCTLGVIVVREDLRDGDVANGLFEKTRNVAKECGASYMVAIAETADGRKFLENHDFIEQDDSLRSRTYFRLELD